MRPLLGVFVAGVITVAASVSAVAGVAPGATVAGTVTLTAAGGGTFPGEGARVTLACAVDGTTRTEVSDEHGAFRFLNVPVDTCSLQADVQGFAAPPVTVITAVGQVAGTDIRLGITPLRVGVNVGGTTPPFHEPKTHKKRKVCCHVTSND